MKRKARYRGIPCWLDMVTNRVTGRNWFYDKLITIMVWVDIYILELDEFHFWVEVDDLENK